MQLRNWFGWVTVALGLVLILGPHNLFHVCGDLGHMVKLANGNEMHMRCWYTASTAQGVGGVVTFIGLMSLLNRWRLSNRVLGPAISALGAFVALMPNYFTPTCMNPKMVCNLETKPALIATGLVMVVTGAIAYFLAKEQPVAQSETRSV